MSTLDFFSQLGKANEKAARILDGDNRSPSSPSRVVEIPNTERRDLPRNTGQECDVAVSEAISHQAHKIAE